MRVRAVAATAGAAAIAVSSVAVACAHGRHADIAIGTTTTAASRPSSTFTVVTAPAAGGPGEGGGGRRRGGGGLLDADGHPYGPALTFTTDVPVPTDLVWVLVVGTDARPGGDVEHAHSDSIHLLAVNPRSREGTLLGFPRDSWVDIPGHGRNKINAALHFGGPQLLATTIHRLTGLPVQWYVVTGFAGLTDIVNEMGGVEVLVDRQMNDAASGARFKPGWHDLDGRLALAFSRDRHDQPNGDFDRSANQGQLILAALTKMRAEVSNMDGVRRWIGVLLRHATFSASMGDLVRLGSFARQLDPGRLRNVVVPGQVGNAGGQSVVFLGADAARLFDDLRPDAVVGQAGPQGPPPTSSSTTTTSRGAPPPPPAPTTTSSSMVPLP